MSDPDGEMTYVSLPQGSLPDGYELLLRNRRTGGEKSVMLLHGGVDPITLAATAGDTLEVRVRVLGQSTVDEYESVVPAQRAPEVVRFAPASSAGDVPLDVVPLVVFSEPMDPASLDLASVLLDRGATPVTGTIAVNDPVALVARFTPAVLLPAESGYVLSVTDAIADMDGDRLARTYSASFRTGVDPVAPTIAVFDRITAWSFEATEPRLDLRDNGRFTFSYAYAAGQWGVGYVGGYQATVDGYFFAFDGGSPEDPWEAVGTLAGDSLSVEFNLAMRQAMLGEGQVRFEDGVYLKAGSSPAAPPPLTGRIAFAAQLTGAAGDYLQVAGPDGIEALTPGRNPAWSPDGRRLAFARWAGADEPGGIYVIDDDGSNLTRVADYGDSPVWSPDGSSIVFVDTAGIRVVDRDGSGAATLVRHGTVSGWTWVAEPAWSPDGTTIAFSVAMQDDFFYPWIGGIYLMNADGSNVRSLTGDSGCGRAHPVWSPDGSEIVVVSCGYIVVYAADGSYAHWLAQGAFPTWSPDGRWLAAYVGADISLIDPSGGLPMTLIPNAHSYAYGVGSFSWTSYE